MYNLVAATTETFNDESNYETIDSPEEIDVEDISWNENEDPMNCLLIKKQENFIATEEQVRMLGEAAQNLNLSDNVLKLLASMQAENEKHQKLMAESILR